MNGQEKPQTKCLRETTTLLSIWALLKLSFNKAWEFLPLFNKTKMYLQQPVNNLEGEMKHHELESLVLNFISLIFLSVVIHQNTNYRCFHSKLREYLIHVFDVLDMQWRRCFWEKTASKMKHRISKQTLQCVDLVSKRVFHLAVTSDKIESAKGIACIIVSLCLEYLEKLTRLDCIKLRLLPLCFLVFCVNSAQLPKGRIVFS